MQQITYTRGSGYVRRRYRMCMGAGLCFATLAPSHCGQLRAFLVLTTGTGDKTGACMSIQDME